MGAGTGTRREFLRLLGVGGAALPLAGCPRKQPPVPSAAVLPPGLDVHCHVFNAADLPVYGFLVNDQLAGLNAIPVLGLYADFLIETIALILSTEAPDDAAENAYLSGTLAETQDPLVTANAATMRLLAAALDPSGASGSLPPPLVDHPQRAAFTSAVAANLQPGAATYLASLTASTPPITMLSPTDIFASSPSGSAVTHYLAWAHQMCDFRTRNIDRLFQLYGPERFGVSVAFPSLVDFYRWLGPGSALQVDDTLAPAVPIERQVALMTRIMGIRGDVLAFVGVDPLCPWTRTQDLLQGCFPAGDSPGQGTGFVGIKIYPPVGYRPLENDHLDDFFSDKTAAAAVRATVETNLNAIYQFCVDNDVPVMTHCNESNYTTLGQFGHTGLATHWTPVLAKYPGLRLNLGHFGSVLNFANNPFDDNHTVIGGLFDSYDHVYADVSCETSASSATFRDEFASAVQRFANVHPRLKERLMYGSDWDMLGFYEGFETFFDDWNAAFVEAAGAVGDSALPSRFLNSNALDFLGLSTESQNQARILAFYGGRNNAPDWLTKP